MCLSCCAPLLLAYVAVMRDAAVCVSGAGRDAEHTSTTYGPCRGPARPWARPDAAPVGSTARHTGGPAKPRPSPGLAPPAPAPPGRGSRDPTRLSEFYGSEAIAALRGTEAGPGGAGGALALSADVFPLGRMTGTGGRRRTVGALISGQRLGLGRIRGGAGRLTRRDARPFTSALLIRSRQRGPSFTIGPKLCECQAKPLRAPFHFPARQRTLGVAARHGPAPTSATWSLACSVTLPLGLGDRPNTGTQAGRSQVSESASFAVGRASCQ